MMSKMKITLAIMLVLSMLMLATSVYAEPEQPDDDAEITTLPDPEFIEGSTFSGKTAYDETLGGFAYEPDGNGGYIITGYNETERSITVPQTIGDVTVTAIGDTAFYGSDLISVVLPDTVTKIGQDSFGDCKELTSVSLPGVSDIGVFAFKGCDMLREAVLSEKLEVIGDSAFEGCVRLSGLKIPASVTEIGTDAFIGCESMILDCSESPIAAEYAERYSIATSFAETGTFQIILCAGITAVLLAALIIIRKVTKK